MFCHYFYSVVITLLLCGCNVFVKRVKSQTAFEDTTSVGITVNEVIATRAVNQFKIYWNVPTFMCVKHGVLFTQITTDYNIIQNTGDTFRGDKITILYDPGMFPALLENGSSSNLFYRNGGIPQAGDLNLHLKTFELHLDELVDKNFDGVGVIDFESWRPIFRQNFGVLKPYKQAAYDYERSQHWFWTQKSIENEAERKFEKYGRIFMERTLKLAKEKRPHAAWGYYAYPYCFNMNSNNKQPDCSPEVKRENDRLSWLFSISDNVYPSVYVSQEKFTESDRLKLVQGRVKEAVRLFNNRGKILPYVRYSYQDTNEFLTENDLQNAFKAIKNGNADGAIIWGSSNHLNSKAKCKKFADFLQNTLGPIVKQF